MTCQELIGFLGDYLDGELAQGVHASFEDHLNRCPACVDYLDSYRMSIRLGHGALCGADDVIPAEVPDDMVQAILSALGKR